MNNALPVVEVLSRERNIETVSVPSRLDIGSGSAFPEHLLDGIAGNQMDQHEHERDHKPDDRQGVENAIEQIA